MLPAPPITKRQLTGENVPAPSGASLPDRRQNVRHHLAFRFRSHVTFAVQAHRNIPALNIARTERDVHPKERRPLAIGQLPEERALLEQVLSHGLVDVGRAVDPDNAGLFTWWAPWRNLRQRNIGWRIDYVLASAPLASRVTRCTVLADFGTSDHAPVVAEFA